MQTEELRYLLALWRASGIGPSTILRVLTQQIPLSELFAHPTEVVQQYDLPQRLISAVNEPDWRGVDRDLVWAKAPQHQIITWEMSSYPALLRQIAVPPPLLFVAGDIHLLEHLQLAMVGTRHPTPAGKETAFQFAKTLNQEGLVITSGLAMGIDAASHEGALASNGKTIAVMGTGPDQVYPRQHARLRDHILMRGAIVTELPVGVKVAAHHFPRRNRIISGLAAGVIVIEAAEESGSLITAQYALEQNREVFALPGSIHNPLARGCHKLIKQGAKLVETVADIFEELPHLSRSIKRSSVHPKLEAPQSAVLPEAQQQLLENIGFEMTAIDTLIERSGLTAEAVSSMLLLLELQGQVVAVPGGYMRQVTGERS